MPQEAYVAERPMPSEGLAELLGRALTDKEFRADLFEKREDSIRGYHLSPKDLDALDKLDRVMLDDAADRLGGTVSAAIKVVISKSF